MTEELTNDSILQFYVAETKLSNSLKTRLFHRHNLVKDIAIKNMDELIGLIIRVDAESEFYERQFVERPLSYRSRIKFYDEAEPKRPTKFTNTVQSFPLRSTIGDRICDRCDGALNVTCTECEGETTVTCPKCGGDGDCTSCGGSGEESCSCIMDDDCTWCGGSGTVDCSSCSGGNCSNCSGDGKVRCPECYGTGLITCPKCIGEGNLLFFDSDVYTYVHQFIEEDVVDPFPDEVHNLYRTLRKRDEYDLDFNILTKDNVKDSFGFLNQQMQDKITESLVARDHLFDELQSAGGEVLFKRDTFKIIPISKVDIEYPIKKKKEASFWSFGTLRNAKNSGFDLPLSPWKILLLTLFFFNLVVMLIVFLNYWQLAELLNLELVAFLKLIPALYAVIVVLLSIIWLAKKRNFKNLTILGTDDSNKMLFFTLNALHLQEAGYGKILDTYFREYSKIDTSELSDFNPKISQTYTLNPDGKNSIFKRNIKFLNLNSRTLMEPEVNILSDLKKITDGYIILINSKDSPNPDQTLKDYFSVMAKNRKLKKAKILFLLDTKKQTENPEVALLAVIPQTLDILHQHQKKKNYLIKFLTLDKELINKYNEKSNYIDEEIVQPMKWLV
ncbi:MAG: hypothetical protein KGD59_08725 [Candidatus Heimdallarchaeota archaeon]|nr:hypothetical protein [Candidatus Heimdallarchaeota archaeon]MBY8994620.1 hypothetical protein [Candidatus Heimdallarchaeota archaeon]